jgi:hypothetical protein
MERAVARPPVLRTDLESPALAIYTLEAFSYFGPLSYGTISTTLAVQPTLVRSAFDLASSSMIAFICLSFDMPAALAAFESGDSVGGSFSDIYYSC